jgi:hypothetical protein
MADGAKGAEAEVAAQEALLRMAQEVESIGRRLRETYTSLAVPPNEDLMLLGEDEMDVSTEIRSVIECVLADSIGPAARDLRAAAAYRPALGKKKEKKAP